MSPGLAFAIGVLVGVALLPIIKSILIRAIGKAGFSLINIASRDR